MYAIHTAASATTLRGWPPVLTEPSVEEAGDRS